MAELKLARLPDRTPIKLTLSVCPELKKGLDAYLQLYCTTYDDLDVALADIIPLMLASFLTADKAYQRHLRSKTAIGGRDE